MRAALTVIVIVLLLGLLAAVVLGLLSFFQSDAAQAIGYSIANGIAELCWFLAFGGFILLVAIGAGYFVAKAGQGARDGAQPAASAVAMLIVASAIKAQIKQGIPVEMPQGWRLGQPDRARWLPEPERPKITVGKGRYEDG